MDMVECLLVSMGEVSCFLTEVCLVSQDTVLKLSKGLFSVFLHINWSSAFTQVLFKQCFF